jgi:type II secretory pathway pseudopilin PulG
MRILPQWLLSSRNERLQVVSSQGRAAQSAAEAAYHQAMHAVCNGAPADEDRLAALHSAAHAAAEAAFAKHAKPSEPHFAPFHEVPFLLNRIGRPIPSPLPPVPTGACARAFPSSPGSKPRGTPAGCTSACNEHARRDRPAPHHSPQPAARWSVPPRRR